VHFAAQAGVVTGGVEQARHGREVCARQLAVVPPHTGAAHVLPERNDSREGTQSGELQ
jgi:hypothetical protein